LLKCINKIWARFNESIKSDSTNTFFSIPSLTYGEYVSSPFKGKTVNYIAETGTIAKKGQILYKLGNGGQNRKIRRANLELLRGQANLEDKVSDIERSKIVTKY